MNTCKHLILTQQDYTTQSTTIKPDPNNQSTIIHTEHSYEEIRKLVRQGSAAYTLITFTGKAKLSLMLNLLQYILYIVQTSIAVQMKHRIQDRGRYTTSEKIHIYLT